MRSRVLSLCDFNEIDLTPYQVSFKADEQAVAAEMDRLLNHSAKWVDGDVIAAGDMVVLALSSEEKKFNREKLKLAVGSNLFDQELEAALVGMKVGETNFVEANGAKVEVKVAEVKNKVRPELTDELVAVKGPEGIDTVQDYREHLLKAQKEELLVNNAYTIEHGLIKEIFSKSEFAIDAADFYDFVKMQLNRQRAVAKSEGFVLEEMTAKDFEGRVPVKSYEQFVLMIQDGTWEYLQTYLIGKYLVEQGEDTVDLSEELYMQTIADYIAFWHGTEESAKAINTYDEFVVGQYQRAFYRKLRAFYENRIIKEEN